MPYHRSRSRHRSPSPHSSKRHRHSYHSSERSRSRDRHRSSRHRSSRYEDSRSSYYAGSSSSSTRHHYDNTPDVDEEALRKKQERVRKWKEAKRLKEEQEAKLKKEQEVKTEVKTEEVKTEIKVEVKVEVKKEEEPEMDEETKKKLAIAAGEREAEEMKRRQQEREQQQREAAEQQKIEEQAEPQLLQQFAAIRKAAAEAADKEETDNEQPEQPDVDMHEDEGKKWSLEDDLESDEEEEMDIDSTKEEAERTFKPLLKSVTKEEDALLAKPKKQVMNKKPKNAMKIGFGLGKQAIKKPAVKKVEAKETEEKKQDTVMTEATEDMDPLEAYMMDVHAETKKINEQDKARMAQLNKPNKKRRGSLMDEDQDEDEERAKKGNEEDDEDIGSDPEDILALAAKKVKRKDIAPVDHSKMDYEPFRKDFYIEPPELRDMTADQVDLLRIELDGIKIRGVQCPKPITKWTHCGLPAGCLEVIRKLKYEKPTSIQAQAIPAVMNGRDVIGVAKTGSGKTIAFLLPMFRHIKDQRPLEAGEGPIAIIMTPTRELATQIHRECKPFLKVLNLRAVCAYGGSPIKDQIADLKRGCEIIVCTPGRMIDLLCANSGRVTNLKRVTYMVMDEADRMFDMGFEPQVMKIVNNVRPSRQTVLFSATFPRQMEALARKVLKKPLEITVGGRSVVCDDVTQIVEVREEDTKFVRLLEILGQLFHDEGEEEASAIIFVDRHEAADNLLRDLIRRGYPCQSLHGGKDQADRDSTIADFKSGVTNVLIATSVAARGLDVKKLKVVINYECPNHMEDYVHRVGRTGRAGNKGTAYTFITPDQDRYAMDICKALKLSGQSIPPDLQALSDAFQNKVREGKERASGSGFGGKGLERLDKDRDLVKKLQKKAYGGGDEDSDEEEIELESTVVAPGITAAQSTAQAMAKQQQPHMEIDKADPKDESLSAAALAAKKAAMVAARITAMGSGVTPQIATTEEGGEAHPVYAEEIVINDYPQKARWRVTNKEQISQITDISGAAITTRGSYFPPGKQPTGNERKLYLFIEGDSEMVVEKAKNEIKRILVEATAAQMEADARGGGGGSGRYQVV
ncbi:P-loop containing nucleoside triphosphate hydrolase protein [Choanephora cucurbitarum]|nr:P-loop containing nucleoside triphosphate hydrolase protein [Choanephora cucurbitarum]